MSTYVLVHGAWHGAWCWYRVAAALERAGHRVITPDLKSLGADRTPPREIGPMTWGEQVAEILSTEKEPVVLVGHSRGGLVISQAAELVPEKVRKLAYVTAFLLRDGESLLETVQVEGTSGVLPHFKVSEDGAVATVSRDVLREVFYGRSPDEDVFLAQHLLAPEALAPSATPIQVTEERFGRLPRIYVECLQDNTISLSLQRQLYTASPCEVVHSLDTDHSPFFSTPEALVEILLGA